MMYQHKMLATILVSLTSCATASGIGKFVGMHFDTNQRAILSTKERGELDLDIEHTIFKKSRVPNPKYDQEPNTSQYLRVYRINLKLSDKMKWTKKIDLLTKAREMGMKRRDFDLNVPLLVAGTKLKTKAFSKFFPKNEESSLDVRAHISKSGALPEYLNLRVFGDRCRIETNNKDHSITIVFTEAELILKSGENDIKVKKVEQTEEKTEEIELTDKEIQDFIEQYGGADNSGLFVRQGSFRLEKINVNSGNHAKLSCGLLSPKTTHQWKTGKSEDKPEATSPELEMAETPMDSDSDDFVTGWGSRRRLFARLNKCD